MINYSCFMINLDFKLSEELMKGNTILMELGIEFFNWCRFWFKWSLDVI